VALRKAHYAIREFALIDALARRFASGGSRIVQGIGDDAAVIVGSTPTWWHITTDLLAEGIHFDLTTTSAESLGYRAAMANLSDIAAMGAVPRYVLTSLAVPRTFKPTQVYQLYAGLMKACRLHQVKLVGGDTSASKAGLFLSIVLIGTTVPKRALFRHGAHVGDCLYVTGTLGDSRAGLQLLAQDTPSSSAAKPRLRLRQSHQRFLVNRHLHPKARLAEGQWLNTARLATAAIDLSDGLSGDLRHLCEESRVGAELDSGSIPMSTACRAYAEAHRLHPVQLALAGGEDYELLFTVPPHKRSTLERQARARGFRVTCIGAVRPRRFGIQIRSGDGRTRPIPMTSYEHFR
jgi:thiamine-monophosphate kinase